MKGLTLTLPWPYLIAAAAARPELGKSWETRDWAPPTWRGEIAIHAAENLKPVGGPAGLVDLCDSSPFRQALASLGLTGRDLLDKARRGVIVAVVRLADVGQVTSDDHWVLWRGEYRYDEVLEPELSFGDYSRGRRVWRLAEIRAIAEPVRCRGVMGLWEVPAVVEAAIRAQLR
jgi:hypothetical protein